MLGPNVPESKVRVRWLILAGMSIQGVVPRNVLLRRNIGVYMYVPEFKGRGDG
jgi:hypothetical protein